MVLTTQTWLQNVETRHHLYLNQGREASEALASSSYFTSALPAIPEKRRK